MNVKKKLLFLIFSLLINLFLPDYAKAATSYDPLPVTSINDILLFNSSWGNESYLGKPCQSLNNTATSIDSAWDCVRPNGGGFKSHIQVTNTDYHCHFEVSGSDIANGTYVAEWQFTIPATFTAAQKSQINTTCGSLYTAPPTVVICDNGVAYPATTANVNTYVIGKHDSYSSTGVCPVQTVVATGTACTAVTNPLPTTMPTGAEYDGKKVTICHFPPGNPGNVRTISISVNALSPHVGNHGDTIWQDGKNCPSLPSDCPPPPPFTPTYPTVNSQTTKNHLPTITGTVGTTPITNSGTFSVAVNGTTYSCSFKSPGNSGKLHAACGNLTVDSTTGWSLTATTSIPVGVYDVVATRNVTGETPTTDQTTNELTIIDSSCPTGTGLINNVCVAQPVVTVNTQTTTDTTPLITGTIGNVALDTGEAFYVSVNGKTYTNGDGNLSVSSLNWSLQIPNANAIPVGLYDVAGGRDDGLPDTTTDELRIDPICTSTQVLVNHVCLDAPTVVSQTTYNTKPTITGTVGTTALGSTEAFSVTVNGVIYAKGNSSLTISGLNWTLNIPTALPVNTYDVDALRAGLAHDQTSGELIILALVSPTVDSKTTTDKVSVPLTGLVGSSTSLQIQVRDASNTIQDSGTATIIGTTWSFLPKVLPAGIYNVVATGDAAHGNLTDSTTGELTVTQTLVVSPTVNTVTTTDKIPPTLTGTVGTSTSLTITVRDSNGLTKATGAATISGTNWSYTPSSPIAAGTYDVEALGETGLKDSTTGELVVTATSIPTVDTKITTDKIAPVLTGTVGSSKSLTITIKSTPQVSGSATISGSTWTFTSPSKITAGNYDVVALGETGLTDATTNELTVTTCILPKVSNAVGDACIDPVPTVVTQTTNSNTPVITGTVGVVRLDTTETFTVAVNGKTYDKSAASSPLVVSGVNWTLTVPATNAIPAGIYDVDAVRNTVSKDVTSKELTINLVCALPQVLNLTHTSCVTPVIPTVNTTTTTDQIPPILTGTVGSSASLSISVIDSSAAVKATGTATITGTTWTFTPSAPIAKGIYDVSAVGETGLTDATTNELTVTMACSAPKVANAAGTACVTPTPTVDFLNTSNTTPTLTGTIGTTVLTTSETFTVTVDGQSYSKNDGHLSVFGTGWTLNVATAIKAGTYDVDAVRQGTHDETTGELTITDNIDICDNGTTKTIARSAFDGSKMGANYYLGKCNIPPCSNPVLPTDPAECTPPLPDPTKDPTDCTKTDAATLAAIVNGTLVCVLPSQPASLIDETVKYTDPSGVDYCISNSISGNGACNPAVDAGCVVTGVQNKSQASVTIKRARIANATTQGGKVCLYNTLDCPTNQPSPLVKYGILTASGNVDLTNAIINKGVAKNVTITGATLESAFIDTPNDYVSSTGIVDNSGGNWITVLGGTTLKTPVDPNVNPAQKSIVTSGVITAGQDTQGNPIRGNITNATYDTDVTNALSILTKGRRTQGIIVNATITGARTTTVAGKTVVDLGTLVSGDIQSGTTPSTYGTVLNTAVTATTITQSATQCSAGGSMTGVGSRGQLMWKEIVRKK